MFLGISLFLFGILKFFDPFKTWYSIQISGSNLGDISYWSGILGEITIGLTFIVATFYLRKSKKRMLFLVIIFSSLAVVGMMMVAVYVHLSRGVPADVLPLKIKPPFIPGTFAFLAIVNSAWAYLSFRVK